MEWPNWALYQVEHDHHGLFIGYDDYAVLLNGHNEAPGPYIGYRTVKLGHISGTMQPPRAIHQLLRLSGTL